MKILAFPSTQVAKDAQFDNQGDIADDDILVVASERVVGVFSHHAFAVTKDRGDLTEFIIDFLVEQPLELKQLVNAIVIAIGEAKRLGFEIHPDFLCFAGA